MKNKTKRIVVLAICCVLCAVAVIGINFRFGGNAVIPSGEAQEQVTPDTEVQVDVPDTSKESKDTAPKLNIGIKAESKHKTGAGAVDTGTEQTIQADPVKPTEPEHPQAETKPYTVPEKHTESDVPKSERNTEKPPVSEEPVVVKPESNTPSGGSTNEKGEVYVPGFGWMPSVGAGSWSVSEGMYENGNKVGIMD